MAKFYEHDGDLSGFVIVGDVLMTVSFQEIRYTVELISSSGR